MIIPTPEFDPLFADDGIPFAQKMRQYIDREFADLLKSEPILTTQSLKSGSIQVQRHTMTRKPDQRNRVA